MKVLNTDIDGVLILEPKVFEDQRGYFFESYNKDKFEKLGLNLDFIQDNQSKSVKNTIRGLHFQKGEYAQAKLVRVLSGRVLDVAVDLRSGSKTYGRHVAVELSEENKLQLLVPRGFAHGYAVLSDEATFFYKVDNVYNKESEGGLLFNDPDLEIDWKVDVKEAWNLLTEKDKNHPRLKDL